MGLISYLGHRKAESEARKTLGRDRGVAVVTTRFLGREYHATASNPNRDRRTKRRRAPRRG